MVAMDMSLSPTPSHPSTPTEDQLCRSEEREGEREEEREGGEKGG